MSLNKQDRHKVKVISVSKELCPAASAKPLPTTYPLKNNLRAVHALTWAVKC